MWQRKTCKDLKFNIKFARLFFGGPSHKLSFPNRAMNYRFYWSPHVDDIWFKRSRNSLKSYADRWQWIFNTICRTLDWLYIVLFSVNLSHNKSSIYDVQNSRWVLQKMVRIKLVTESFFLAATFYATIKAFVSRPSSWNIYKM